MSSLNGYELAGLILISSSSGIILEDDFFLEDATFTNMLLLVGCSLRGQWFCWFCDMQGCSIQGDRGHKPKQVFKFFNLKCHLCIYLHDFLYFPSYFANILEPC